MMRSLILAGLCAASALALPAAAQQGQPSPAASTASPEGTSAPPAAPFRDGGRPESHGGDLPAASRNPASGPAAQPLGAETRQSLEGIARIALTAQQYGNLASKRHTSPAMHALGDRMVVTASRINKALGAYPDLKVPDQMPPEERATLDALARRADEVEFGVSVAQWVAESYPRLISALEPLSGAPELRDLAGAALPDLRSQLAEAQRILQTAGNDPSQLRAPGASGGSGGAGSPPPSR